MDNGLTEVWIDNHGDTSEVEAGTVHTPDTSQQSRSHRLIRAYVMFLLKWQTLFKVSDAGMSVLFLFITVFLSFMISSLHNY